ncbi:MAG TPA: oxidoreductase [Pyrinomonadaceae bacterium]|jgi:NAD(P)-dependent dehydrogenase (short-subunit alcohol dehydrogenase family)
MSEKKVWFITGTSAGIGRELAEKALEKGHQVVATARKPEVLRDLAEKYPETVLTLKLDVTNKNDIAEARDKTIENFGRIDVVVNNAGYGLLGAVEEPSDEQIRGQFETNFFGVVNVVRETLPVLRAQKSGHIINVSSGLGFFAYPSYGYYSATKFAVQGLSEALAQEVAPLGIKVTIAEPGGTRTDFIKGVVRPENVLPEDYPSTTELFELFNGRKGGEFSDPRRIAEILVETVESENPPLHLPLGEDSYNGIQNHLDKISREIAERREQSLATGFQTAAA